VVEIEPLNVVPVGNIIGNWADDAESEIAGRVVAETKRAINDIIRSVVIAILVSMVIFFIFPTRRMLREEKTGLNNNLDEKAENNLLKLLLNRRKPKLQLDFGYACFGLIFLGLSRIQVASGKGKKHLRK
jgi:hypothetical protein